MVEKKERVFASFFHLLVTTLQDKCNFSLTPTQSRLQFGILLVTVDFLFFSTGLAFCLAYLSISRNIQMTPWFLIVGLIFIGISIFGLAFIWCLADYFRGNPREEHISDAVTSKLAEQAGERLPSNQRVVGSNPSRDAILTRSHAGTIGCLN